MLNPYEWVASAPKMRSIGLSPWGHKAGASWRHVHDLPNTAYASLRRLTRHASPSLSPDSGEAPPQLIRA
jgi:hypothetical protein